MSTDTRTNTDAHGLARTGTAADGTDAYDRAERLAERLGPCPSCGSSGFDLDLADDDYYETDGTRGVRWHAYCGDCGLTTPLVDDPEEAAGWWERLRGALAADDAREMAALEETPAAPVQVGLEIGTARMLMQTLESLTLVTEERADGCILLRHSCPYTVMTAQQYEMLTLGIEAIRVAMPLPLTGGGRAEG